MSNVSRLYMKWLMVASALAAVAVLAKPMPAQTAPPIQVGNTQITGLPDDWTHHYVVFSDPGTADDAIKNGSYNKWFSIVNDPRYVMQQLKRGLPAQGPAAGDVARFENERRAVRDSAEAQGVRNPWERARRRIQMPALENDWSMLLTNAGTNPGVGAGMYPAKFSFNLTPSSPANCASAASPDYVVYNTGVPGLTGSSTAAGQATLVAFYNLYSGCSSDTSGPKSVPAVYWAFNTGGTVSTSVVLSSDGTQVAFIQTPSSGNPQLVVLKPGTTLETGRTLTGTIATSGTEITLTGTSQTFTAADVGAQISSSTGNIPASDTIATILSTTTATLTTAPSSAKTGASITITADALSPYPLLSTSYPCTAPCMIATSFSGTSRTDTISSPFYDYSGDILYVGDAQGYLHKFHPVFGAAPAEITSGGWPAEVSKTTSPALTSPVYDSGTTGDVFVGDEFGYLYAVSSAGGATASLQLGTVNGSNVCHGGRPAARLHQQGPLRVCVGRYEQRRNYLQPLRQWQRGMQRCRRSWDHHRHRQRRLQRRFCRICARHCQHKPGVCRRVR